MKSCWVIEASGKIPFFRKIIPKGDSVVATFGYLYQMPKSLWPLSIDKSFKEHNISAIRQENIDRIQNYFSKVHHVIIATDDDQEGELIARDVFNVANDMGLSCSRVKFSELSKKSIYEALNNKSDVDTSLAEPALRRRLVDRIIGSVFSDRENNIYCGRVMTPLLSCADNGTSSTLIDIKDKPWSAGDCLYHVSRALDTSPLNVSKSMQKLYESGKLSYPRSDVNNISMSAIKNIHSSAVDAGLRSRFSLSSTKEKSAHPSPYPMIPVDINEALSYLSEDDAVLNVIARKWVSISTGGYIKIPVKGISDEVRLVAIMMNSNLGRPSTLASISSKVVKNGLFLDGELTDKGKLWLNSSPLFLKDDRYKKILQLLINPKAPLDIIFKKIKEYDKMKHQFCNENDIVYNVPIKSNVLSVDLKEKNNQQDGKRLLDV